MGRKVYQSVSWLIAAVIFFTSCGRDDEGLKNILTITGNDNNSYNLSYSSSEAFYIPARLTECTNVLYRSDIWVNLSPESVFWMALFHSSESDEIPEGAFTPAGSCQEGFNGSFTLIIEKAAEGALMFSSGTVTITREGDIYDIDADLVIAPESGGGTLKGNFSGPLQFAPVR